VLRADAGFRVLLLDALVAARRDAQDVKKVLERMKALGVEPNEITFMDLLEIYKEKGDVWIDLF
jgi:pentatricopeptide repeat protein